MTRSGLVQCVEKGHRFNQSLLQAVHFWLFKPIAEIALNFPRMFAFDRRILNAVPHFSKPLFLFLVMNFRRFPSVVVLLATALLVFLSAEVKAAHALPVWEWKAQNEQDKLFDGTRFLEFPEVRKLYRPDEGFSLEIKLKPMDRKSAGALVSDYSDSKTGGWYFSMGDEKRPMRTRFVGIDRSPYPNGYRRFDANRNLRGGEWSTLLLVSDGQSVSLFLDGRLAGEVALNQPLLPPSKGTFTIGKRNKDFFTGEIESVRLWDQPIAVNHLSNSSFEEGDKIEDILLWHRMAGTSAFVGASSDWEIDETTAYHGKRSLKGAKGTPLVLMEEVWERVNPDEPWVFSVYMKADKEGLKCELSAGAYWRLEEQKVSEQVELTTQWKRYDLVVTGVPSLYRRYMPMQGPLTFRIEPQGQGTVWVDAVQWSRGETAKTYSAEGPEGWFVGSPPLRVPQLEARVRPEGEKSSWTGSVPIRVFREGTVESAGRQPVTVGIPFNRDTWDGRGNVSLRNEMGQPIEVQTEVFTDWSGSQGVQMLGLFFTDDFIPGWQNYTMEIESGPKERSTFGKEETGSWELKPPATPGQLWGQITDAQGNVLFEAASLRAIDIHGKGYDSQWDRNAEWKLERDGSLYKTYRSAGQLVDRDGQGLLAYIARIHIWRDIPGVKLEVSLVNSRRDHSIRVRTIYWHTTEGEGNRLETVIDEGAEQQAQGYFEKASLADVSPPRYFIRKETQKGTVIVEGRSSLFLKGKTRDRAILAHAPEAWQSNPVALAWADGEWRGYFWPDNATRSLAFPRGVSLTRGFWLRESDDTADVLQAWDSPVFGMADSQWWASTDVMISFFATDAQRFPFIEKKLSSEKLLGRIAPDRVDATNAYGVFDYGDTHGDGGWSNLESFTDWSALLTGLRSGDETAIAIGLRSAQHYRDVDMNQTTGATYMHNISHNLGRFDMSHSWPEGVAMHYLLTGSRRSEEMILKHGEYLLNMNKAELERGLRTLGRYLTNLANIYQITGDNRYKKRFLDQLELSQKLLAEVPDMPDRSIFSNIRNWEVNRLVPYHAWYGISAMQKMESLTGDPELADLIDKEVLASLNPELYIPSLVELWPGVSPEEAMPLMVADLARHRGNFFYPVMTKHAEMREDAQLAKLTLDSLYVSAIEGRASGIQSILSSAPLKFVKEGQEEEDLISAAVDLMWNAAADTLLNGDFSQSAEHWHHWRPLPNKEVSINWERFRKKMLALDSNVRKEGRCSLRFELAAGDVNSGFNKSISVDTSRFRLEPGQYVLKGWLRWDAGAMPLTVGMELRNLEGGFEKWTIGTGEQGYGSLPNTSTVKLEDIAIDSPDVDGWCRIQIYFDVEKRTVANLMLNGKLKPGSESGHIWIDGFKLERKK